MGQTTGQDNGATMFVAGRIVIAVIAVVAVLWAMTYAINQFVGDRGEMAQQEAPVDSETPAHTSSAAATSAEVPLAVAPLTTPEAHGIASVSDETLSVAAGLQEIVPNETAAAKPATVESVVVKPAEPSHQAAVVVQKQPAVVPPVSQPATSPAASVQPNQTAGQVTAAASHGSQPSPEASADNTNIPATTGHLPAAAPTPVVRPVGVALVDAIIKPLDYELTDRFWGWRPNDIINVTDNVENFQLGVLEVTRRAIVELAQRISRTGSADSFDRNLENAMSWIMTKATDYWFPSPETKYEETLDELRSYKTKLLNGNAYFYTRADNLIPLFEVFEDLLGSCDQNLVKHMEADGTKVGMLTADNYFFYAKGVAHAMTIILEGVQIDFAKTMDNRRSSELLHHAIESCRIASELDPWFITNSDLDGILANHRANMAAPISHARYYLGQLVKTLGV